MLRSIRCSSCEPLANFMEEGAPMGQPDFLEAHDLQDFMQDPATEVASETDDDDLDV